MKTDQVPPGAERKFIVTRAEAAKILNRPDSARYHVHVKVWAPTDDDQNGYEPSSYLTVTREEAIRFAGNLFSDKLEERGARIKITMSEGKRLRHVRGELKEVPITTVWIG